MCLTFGECSYDLRSAIVIVNFCIGDMVPIPVSINSALQTIYCPGVQIRGLTAITIPRKRQEEILSVEEYKFTPFFDDALLVHGNPGTPTPSSQIYPGSNVTVAGFIDLILENYESKKLKILDIFAKAENSQTESIYPAMTAKPTHVVRTCLFEV